MSNCHNCDERGADFDCNGLKFCDEKCFRQWDSEPDDPIITDVKRLEPMPHKSDREWCAHKIVMEEFKYGRYVSYEDLAALKVESNQLKAENEALQKRVAELESAISRVVREFDALADCPPLGICSAIEDARTEVKDPANAN